MCKGQAKNSPALLVLGKLHMEYTATVLHLPLLQRRNLFRGNRYTIQNSLRRSSTVALKQLISKSFLLVSEDDNSFHPYT